MKRQFTFSQKPYVYIWLLLTMLIFVACSSPTLEPGVESGTELPTGDSQTQQSYPAPEQPIVERSQSGYPGPLPNESPALPTPLPTFVPPPICDFKPPVEVSLNSSSTSRFTVANFRFVPLKQEMFGFGIASWLPDNQRLLVTTGDASFGAISTINIIDGEIQHFADRIDIPSQPIWLEQEQAVMFIDVVEGGWEAKLSRGSGDFAETVKSNLDSAHLSLNPKLQEATVLSNASPVLLSPTGEVRKLLETEQQIGSSLVPISSDDTYKFAWSSNGEWLAQYSNKGFLLTNMDAKQTCLLDLGNVSERGQRWGIYAQWSSDNRYLGIITTVNYPEQLVSSTELTVVDFQSNLIQVFTLSSEASSWHDFAWSPQNNGLVAKITVAKENNIALDGLFFIDIASASSIHLLPEATFYAGIIGQGLSWSPDGKTLALTCPNGPLCLLDTAQ